MGKKRGVNEETTQGRDRGSVYAVHLRSSAVVAVQFVAVAAALVSSLLGLLVPADTVVFGEIGLSGEVRPVGQTDVRLREAKKLGFARAIVPKTRSVPTVAATDPNWVSAAVSR